MKNLTVNQFGISVMLICFTMIFTTYKSFCQDTLHMNKVKVAYNGLVSKSGHVEHIWYRKVKVRSGYITKNNDGSWMVNGRKCTIMKNELN